MPWCPFPFKSEAYTYRPENVCSSFLHNMKVPWNTIVQTNIHLNTLDTIGNCQRLAFTVSVSQHMHKITNLWKFELNRSSKLRDNYERKNTLVTRSCVLSVLDFETSNSKLEVLKSNLWKITSFSKTTLLQRELFLTMFYTTNLSPLLVTNKGFMLIIILSNYQ